ncbi:MAG: hypothetical protein NVSMB55_07280 [Mycobacteriales bacterium]
MQRKELVPIVVVYVIPVTLATIGLAAVGLWVLAIALLVIEGFVATAVVLARRQPATPTQPSRRPWLVPALMVGALGLFAVIASIAARLG